MSNVDIIVNHNRQWEAELLIIQPIFAAQFSGQ